MTHPFMTALIRHLADERPAPLSPQFINARMQAQAWRSATRHALACVALAPGQSALDVGAGCGDAMQLMAERVGPGGKVTGVDINASLIAQAQGQLRCQGVTSCTYLQGDVTRLPTLDAGSFDLVFARMLVLHISRPADLMRRLWAMVRPGGVLLVMDHDYGVLANGCVDTHPGLARALVVLQRLLSASYQFPRSSIDLPRLFESSGIGRPDECEVSSRITPHAEIVPWTRATLRELRDRVTTPGSPDARALDDLDVALMVASADPRFTRWPDMVSAWKRKPDARGTAPAHSRAPG